MPRLNRIAAPVLVAAMGIGLALPAQAQDWRHDRGDRYASYHAATTHSDIRADIAALGRDIDRAAARRTISRKEANGLRRDLNQLQRSYTRFARDGLTRGEVRALESRVQSLRFALRSERRDTDRRRG